MTQSKAFCVLPWVNQTIKADGTILPCCAFDDRFPIGSLRSAGLKALWNSEELKAVRLALKEDRQIPQCGRCYELEAAGCLSTRQQYNRSIPSSVADDMTEDGTVPHLPSILDIRFSNVCNFRCRYCGPDRSTSWYEEYQSVWGPPTTARVLKPAASSEELLAQIGPLLPHLRQVYFCGGEPLIAQEHYTFLKLLLENGRTDVALTYSTNFSETVFQGTDVFELWSRFEDVQVGASLDASGSRGEYIRKNQRWSQVVENRQRMMRVCPKARFILGPTLSALNALCLPDFHQEWIELGYADPAGLSIGFLLEPVELSVQVLPKRLKDALEARYRSHQNWLRARFGSAADDAVVQFGAIVDFARKKDISNLSAKFLETVWILDQIRGESLPEVFPELAAMMRNDEPKFAMAPAEIAPPTMVNTVPGHEQARSPLIHAVYQGRSGEVEALCKRGVIADDRDEQGRTALLIAAEHGYREVVRVLLAAGAAPDAADLGGRTALTMAVMLKDPEASEEIGRLLLNSGASIELRDRQGRTPLLLASAMGNIRIVRLLVEHGADLEARDLNGVTPLMAATHGGDAGVVRLLLEKGASVTVLDNNGCTVLAIARDRQNPEVFGLLWRAGARLTAPTAVSS